MAGALGKGNSVFKNAMKKNYIIQGKSLTGVSLQQNTKRKKDSQDLKIDFLAIVI